MKKTLSLLLMLTVFSILICGCGNSDHGSDLNNTSWQTISFGGSYPIAGRPGTIEFADGQVSGTSGCNSYFGSYDQSGTSLSFNQMGWTEMACIEPEGLMDQEYSFFEFINSASAFSLDDGNLILANPSGETMVLTPAS